MLCFIYDGYIIFMFLEYKMTCAMLLLRIFKANLYCVAEQRKESCAICVFGYNICMIAGGLPDTILILKNPQTLCGWEKA